MPLSNSSEREFFQLAGTYFACRWCVMGNDIEPPSPHKTPGDFEGDLRGMVDYGWAMRDFAKKWKNNPNHSEKYKP